MRSTRFASSLLILPLLLTLTGCPRRVGPEDAGGSADGGTTPLVDSGLDAGNFDSGYHEGSGNSFTDPLIFDDLRVSSIDPSALPATPSPARPPMLGEVYRVTDGDTIWVRGIDIVFDAPVRMIGVDTPEIMHDPAPADCFGDEAHSFSNQLLNRRVWLTYDRTIFDNFNRVLAYVHVGTGPGDMWQRQLLRRGFAWVFTVGDNNNNAPLFEDDQRIAQGENLGLWRSCR